MRMLSTFQTAPFFVAGTRKRRGTRRQPACLPARCGSSLTSFISFHAFSGLSSPAVRSSPRASLAAGSSPRRARSRRPAPRPDLPWGAIALLVICFAVLARVRFDVGAGFTVSTQLLFVPMLFQLPAQIVPVAVAAGFVLAGAGGPSRPAARRAARAAARRLVVQPRAGGAP